MNEPKDVSKQFGRKQSASHRAKQTQTDSWKTPWVDKSDDSAAATTTSTRRMEASQTRQGRNGASPTKPVLGFGFLSWPRKASPHSVQREPPSKQAINKDESEKMSSSIDSSPTIAKRSRRTNDMMLGESAAVSVSPVLDKKTTSAKRKGYHRAPEGFRYVRDD